MVCRLSSEVIGRWSRRSCWPWTPLRAAARKFHSHRFPNRPAAAPRYCSTERTSRDPIAEIVDRHVGKVMVFVFLALARSREARFRLPRCHLVHPVRLCSRAVLLIISAFGSTHRRHDGSPSKLWRSNAFEPLGTFFGKVTPSELLPKYLCQRRVVNIQRPSRFS
jgi:hypothetical protein